MYRRLYQSRRLLYYHIDAHVDHTDARVDHTDTCINHKYAPICIDHIDASVEHTDTRVHCQTLVSIT